ncbi:MAG TPA: discoidin domain-containing protein [Candidatus Lumbricidophila sp.]|nr:discoidin domain-containing protein [Candidatus Lumbricidophila sp.]
MTSSTVRRRAIAAICSGVLVAAALVALAPPANAATPAALRREVSQAKPLVVANFYQGGEGPNQNDTVSTLWSSIPADLKENTVVNFIANNHLNNIPAVTDWITSQADAAQAAGIPFMVQALNGETSATQTIPASFFDNLATTHSSMQGINAAELYNGSNQSAQLVSLYSVVVNRGLHFVWSDTNLWDSRGLFLSWLEDNASLLAALKANPQNAVFLNKESFGDTDTDAVNLGMWLAGYIGNWGSSSDWWHWGLNSYGQLYGSGGQSWKDILQYPEAQTAQSMVKVASQGGTAFMIEAQWFNLATGGARLAPFEFAIAPLLREMKAGAFHIPTKAEVLAQNKMVYKGGVYTESTIWDTMNSNIFPRTGRYGLIPMVPVTIPDTDLTMFEDIATSAKDQAWFDARYPQEAISSNTFLLHNTNTWYWMNFVENRNVTTQSTFAPRRSPASEIGISAGPHTFATMTESQNRVDVMLNNYRTNKSNVRTDTLYGTAPSSDFDQVNTYKYIYDYTSVGLDANGNPLVDANGVVSTAAGRPLNDRSSRDVRTTTFTVSGTWQGGQPLVTFAANTVDTRPYTTSSVWDAANKRLTVTIMHNGLVKFSVQTDGPGVATGTAATVNLAVGKPASQSSEWPYGLTASRAVDGNTDGVFGNGSVSHTDSQTDPWWKVDLGAEYPLGAIDVWNRSDCCSDRLANYKVEVLNAAQSVVWSSTRVGYPSPTETVNAGGATGRYVRISLSGANRILALAEVKVHPVADLALGKAASQSSEWPYGLTASRAVDGNTDGVFGNGSVSHTDSQTDPWWKVDLGAEYPLGAIDVWNRSDCCSDRLANYKVEVLNAAQSVVWSSTRVGYPSPTETVNAGGATGRYVRISLSGANRIVSLAEVKVAMGVAPVNFALGKVASQSSTYSGGDGTGFAARAVDGNTDGIFANGSVSHTNAETNPWWKVDLGQSRTINEIEVWNRADSDPSRLSNYRLEVLNSANVVVWSSDRVGFPWPSETVSTGGVIGQHVRVSLTGTNRILSMAEVLVR